MTTLNTDRRKASHRFPCIYFPVTPSKHPQSTYLVPSDDAVPYPLGLLLTSPNSLEVLLRSLAPFQIGCCYILSTSVNTNYLTRGVLEPVSCNMVLLIRFECLQKVWVHFLFDSNRTLFRSPRAHGLAHIFSPWPFMESSTCGKVKFPEHRCGLY